MGLAAQVNKWGELEAPHGTGTKHPLHGEVPGAGLSIPHPSVEAPENTGWGWNPWSREEPRQHRLRNPKQIHPQAEPRAGDFPPVPPLLCSACSKGTSAGAGDRQQYTGQLTLTTFTQKCFKEKLKLHLLQKRRFPALLRFSKRPERPKSHLGNYSKLAVYLHLNPAIWDVKYPVKNSIGKFHRAPLKHVK